MELLILVVLLGLVPAGIAYSKGRGFLRWWLFGALLFIVALPASILVGRGTRSGYRRCPHCAESILSEARVCRYCGRDVPSNEAKPRIIDEMRAGATSADPEPFEKDNLL